MAIFCVKQSDSPSTLHTFWEEPDLRNTDTITNYNSTPKYVVDVLGGAVLTTYRRLPESRNHRHLTTNTYVKTYENGMQSNAASSLSQRTSEERDEATAPPGTMSDTASARNALTLTAHESDMLPGAHHPYPSVSPYSATKQLRSLERQMIRSYIYFPMTTAHMPMYENGMLVHRLIRCRLCEY